MSKEPSFTSFIKVGVLYMWFRRYFCPPPPPTRPLPVTKPSVKFSRIGVTKMLSAVIKWVPSISSDVVGQQINVRVNDVSTVSTLLPDVVEQTVVVNPGDSVHVDIFAYSRVFRSATLSFSSTSPLLPESPTNGSIEFIGDEAPVA